MKRGFENNFENMASGDAEMKRSRGGGGDKFEVRLLIPSKTAGSIIGRAGANIKELRQKNNANVRVPDNDGPERVMWIIADDCQTSINVIEQSLPSMCDDGGNSRGRESQYSSSMPQEVRLLIHESIVGGIIGRGGSTINQIERESKAKVHAYQTCAPQSSDRIVVVKGGTEEIITALQKILAFLATRDVQGHHDMYDPNNFDCFYADLYGGYGTPRDATPPNNMQMHPRGNGMPMYQGGNDMPMYPRGNDMPMYPGGNDMQMYPRGNEMQMYPRGNDNMGSHNMPMYPRGNDMQFSNNAMRGGLNGFSSPGGMQTAGFGNAMNSFSSPNFPKEEGIGFSNGMNNMASPMLPKDADGPVQTSKVTVPKDMGGAIIGPGGERIKKIRMESQAQIKVDEPEDGSEDRVITISGTPQSIQTAQYLLQQCVRTYGKPARGGYVGGGM